MIIELEPDLLINYSLRHQVPLEKIRGINFAMDDVFNGWRRDNLRSINEKFRRVGMLHLHTTKLFEKKLKRYKHNHKVQAEFKTVVSLLLK